MSLLRDLVVKKPVIRNTAQDREEVSKQMEGTLSSVLSGKQGKSAKIGATFEKELEETIQVYEALKLAYIQKFYPRSTFIPPRNGKQGFMMYTAKTGFDYIGGIIESNTPIFIEAKTTKDGSIPVLQESNGIKKHQIDKMLWMEENTKFNVFFLWQVRSAGGVVFKFTPSELLDAVGSKKSLSIVDAEDRGFPKMLKTKIADRLVYDFLYLLEGVQ